MGHRCLRRCCPLTLPKSREQAFECHGAARQRAARGTFDPGYRNQTVGKLMIGKLRAERTAPRGGQGDGRALLCIERLTGSD